MTEIEFNIGWCSNTMHWAQLKIHTARLYDCGGMIMSSIANWFERGSNSHKIPIICNILKSSRFRAEAAELHDLPVALFNPRRPLRPESVVHGGRRRCRQLGGVGVGPEVGLDVLMDGSESVVPAAETLVLESLNRCYARGHNPRSCGWWRTHLLQRRRAKQLQIDCDEEEDGEKEGVWNGLEEGNCLNTEN